MKRFVVLMALGIFVSAAACKERARQRRDAARSSVQESWLLRYQPANTPRYKVAVTVKSPSGSLVSLDLTHTLEVMVTGDERHMHATFAEEQLPSSVDVNDLVRAAALLFPELPEAPVYDGDRWTVPLYVRVDNSEELLTLSHELRCGGEIACPQGDGTCARIALEAPERDARFRIDGKTWSVDLSFRGNIVFDVERGVVAEAEVHATATVANASGGATINATIVATPVSHPYR